MVFEFLMNMLLAMLLIGLFNAVRGFLRIRKILKKYKDDPNIEGITIVNGEVKVIQKKSERTTTEPVMKELVMDEICNRQIEKEKAYRVVKDGIEHFFCSWECREQFLNNENKQ